MNIKNYLLTIVSIAFIGSSASAQIVYKKEKNDSTDSKSYSLSIGKVDEEDKDSIKKEISYPRSYGGITFTRVDWGFSRLSDEGSFTLSEENQFMSYKRSSNFGFDIAQYGIRFSDQFKVYLSAGFEWNYWRLKQNIQLLENTSPIDYVELDESANYSKNVITSTYLRLPLSFELRSKQLENGKRVKLAFGAMTGILLKGTQRLKSDANGKQKFKDNYNLQTFQYGPFVRIGYDNLGLFAKYYMNDLFEKSPEQEGLRNLTFGLTLGF
ncbi:PorT family protein [Sphingobacterium daejeonense]|uniref:PorT family protein n=1 Tax=Sphingobacterium daejeonense TaxID=371142 RepID=UPI0021A6BBE7|nr:PorT family protein [Sphingobacterium daejeonense]MCT1530821.1 PorT family protein [Sphingobacterium daejeonense]